MGSMPSLRRLRHPVQRFRYGGAVSKIVRVAPPSLARLRTSGNRDGGAVTIKGVSSSRWSFHFAAEACGSRSIKATVCPARSASTARWIARVVLPVPPFRDNTANVFILLTFLIARLQGCRNSRLICCKVAGIQTCITAINVSFVGSVTRYQTS